MSKQIIFGLQSREKAIKKEHSDEILDNYFQIQWYIISNYGV
ncbi:MAG: hypothetical protein ABI840_07840 [bacterium]